MNHYIVNKDSSLILVNSVPYIVYLSSTSEAGQVVTIRDVDGILPSSQSIIISTVGCTLTDGLSTLSLQQKFAYLTLKSLSNSVWTVINSSAFSNINQDYTVKGTSFITGNTSNVSATNYVSSYTFQANTLTITSNAQINALQLSNLVVNNSSLGTYMVNINGSLYNSDDITIAGTLSNTGYVSLFQSFATNANLSTLGSALLQGPILQSTTSLMNISSAISTSYSVLINNNLTSAFTTISSATSINRALRVPNVSTNSVNTTRITVSSLYLSTNSYIASRTDLQVLDTTYNGPINPVLQITQGLASQTTVADWLTTDNFVTQSLIVDSLISSSALSSVVFSSARIQNPNGQLQTSNIVAGTFSTGSINNNLGISTANIEFISVQSTTVQNSLTTSDLEGPLINTGLFIGTSINTSNLNLGNVPIIADALALSTIYVSSGINGNNINSIVINNATIYNGSGSFQTLSTISINANVANLGPTFYEINSGNVSFNIVAPLISMSTATTTSISAYSTLTSSFYCTSIEFGAPLSYSTINPNALYLIPSTVTSNTPYEYVSGLGTTYSPLTVRAANSKTLYMNLGNISSFSTSYLNVSMNYINNVSSVNTGSAGFRIRNSATFSTLIQFNSQVAGLQTLSLSNYPIDRNFNPVSQQYYLSNLNTPPITDDAPNIVVGGLGSSILYSSDSGNTWMNPQTTVFSQSVSGLAWSGEKWVATGNGTANTLAYSYTGLIWYGALKTIFTTESFCVATSGSLWVAGGSGTNSLAYSYDGVSWTGLGTNIFTSVKGVAWNGYMWIALGSGTTSIAYSYNGIVWSAGPNIFSSEGRGVAWGANKWVAVGAGSTHVAYSYDGINWTPLSGLFSVQGNCVGWNGSQWLAGGAGTYPLLYSASGTIWSAVNPSPMTIVTGISWGNNWVIAGSSGFAVSSNGIYWTASSQTSSASCVVTRKVFQVDPILYTTGPNYTLAYSIGGVTWTIVNSLISGIANSILWSGSLWLASMASGFDSLIYSYDGISWVGLGKSTFSGHSNQIAWNGYIWVATGTGTNSLAYSYDGINWTGLGSSIFSEGFGVAWVQGQFVATGTSTGSTWAATSINGINWTTSGSTIFTTPYKLAFGNGLIVATGVNIGNSSLAYSTNGLTWTSVSPNPFSISAYDVAWNGTQWLAIGTDSTNNVAYSANGMNWTPIAVPNISAKGLTTTNSYWYLTGATSSDSVVFKSSDGLNWYPASSTFFGPAYTLASKQLYPYGTKGSTVTIACGNGSTALAISAEGISWVPVSSSLTTAYCVAWNGSIWVAGGVGTSTIIYSSNGVNWTNATISGLSSVRGIAWTKNKWIAVGDGSNIWADSSDGINWTSYLGGAGGFFSSASYGILGSVGGWLAVGNDGLRVSSSGATWTPVGTGLFSTGRAVQTNGKQFIAVGSGTNSIAYSYDGLNWVGLGLSIFSISGYGVAFGTNSWVAVGQGTNSLAVSNDGITWTGLGTSIFSSATSVYWNGVTFIATGQGVNTLATSPDGYNWTGLGSSTFTSIGYGSGGKLPLSRYSVKEPHLYNWRSSGFMAATSQTTIQKFSNTSAWDSSVYTAEGYSSSAYLTFSPTSVQGSTMMGLSESPSTNTTPTQLNYAFALIGGFVSIYEVGFQVKAFSTYKVGDIFNILYNGTNVQYYWNGTLLRSISRVPGATLYMMAILYDTLNPLENIDFHAIYSLTTVPQSSSVSSFVASVVPGLSASFCPPIYLTLGTDLVPSVWTFNVSIGGTVPSINNSLYADVYINSTKFWSTNVISNLNLTNISSYNLSFNVTSPYSYTQGDTLNFRLLGSKGGGISYVYGNWLSNVSSSLVNSTANPNAVEYLEFFHNSVNAGQTSELTVSLSDVSTNTTSYINSNVGLVMNKSYISWNYPLNGTTVQNSYNDTQTRSLLYTGGLYNASDSNLKHSIEYIDCSPYLTAIKALSLKRYSFNEAYCSTFLIADKHQLGILTCDVPFSSMILDSPFNYCELSTIKTVDRTQFRYAHLATTQALIGRISTLRAALETT